MYMIKSNNIRVNNSKNITVSVRIQLGSGITWWDRDFIAIIRFAQLWKELGKAVISRVTNQSI